MDSTLLQMLIAAAVAALVALVVFAARWLSAQTKSTTLLAVITEAKETMLSVVAYIEAEIKPALLAAQADGIVTREEGEKLKAQAIKIFKIALADRGMARLKRALGLTDEPLLMRNDKQTGVDVFVSGLVERSLSAQKALTAQVEAARQVVVAPNPLMPPASKR